ncbi:prephenate dehydrogenase/arogenate dehydrogenase family protein [Haloarculaceae archaeon H-GB2-1]|nr:prephenate dehydrogenase/arogenate dehydrogenase family protein [Haloarculaceae archaeon H-GB1-1]MEA5387395.1 prephenate dehydrogenase/arogenate dehydrogenase family protein [Haloarculaceae archaeon H-GB11]MEA5408868.1 prephenate dehydrogenase/arogenate dehydrogenase family protein [Haloarculaceae archaeon H-GB2-1]
MKLLVVGAGEMGRWFARSVDSSVSDLDVAFTDLDEEAARAAAEGVDGRTVESETGESFDVICIAVPLPAAADAIAEYAARATEAVVDVSGAMADPISAMAEHAPEVERVSFHPLFSATNAPGNVAVVADHVGPVTDRLRDALEAAGNDVFETTADEHDEAMETVQARAHAAVLAFGLAADDVDDAFATPISEGLFDLLEQVTDGDPRVYADIQDAFDGADDVAAAAAQLADADRETFQRLYEDAR